VISSHGLSNYIGIFDPALRTVAPLTFSLVQFNERGGMEFGPKTDRHLPQSQFTGKFYLDDDIWLWCQYS
jgi:hypothetical protein